MVRFGISLYGLYPSEEVDKSSVDLILAMELRTKIVNLKTVPAGMRKLRPHYLLLTGDPHRDYPRGLCRRLSAAPSLQRAE